MKSTKIVVTIGPSSASFEKIKHLLKSGMNVARVNFSHGDYVSNGGIIQNLKKARKELGIPLAIMADLQGPRIRTLVPQEIEIKKGEEVIVSDIFFEKKVLESSLVKIVLDWSKIIQEVRVGNILLI